MFKLLCELFNGYLPSIYFYPCLPHIKVIFLEFLQNTTKKQKSLRWLDWIFWGGYLPSLSINYVAMSKDMEKRFPQLYYIKMKNSFDLGFIAIGVAMAA